MVKPGDNSGDHIEHEAHENVVAGRAKRTSKPKPTAPARPFSDGHQDSETHLPTAVAGDGHTKGEIQHGSAIPVIIELWRRRQSWHRAEKSLTLQASAICRRYCEGDKTED